MRATTLKLTIHSIDQCYITHVSVVAKMLKELGGWVGSLGGVRHIAVLIVIYEKNPKVYSFKLLNSDSLINIQQVQFSGTAVR